MYPSTRPLSPAEPSLRRQLIKDRSRQILFDHVLAGHAAPLTECFHREAPLSLLEQSCSGSTPAPLLVFGLFSVSVRAHGRLREITLGLTP